MLHETLKALRKRRGYSQEEVASRLNVVRQTVSKWEKALSVPDADALVRLAELYEVSVGELLGAPAGEPSAEPSPPDFREIAEQLSRINEQLVIKNRRAARIWKTVCLSLLALLVVQFLLIVSSVILFSVDGTKTSHSVSETHFELVEP